jgi:TPR repeat protein
MLASLIGSKRSRSPVDAPALRVSLNARASSDVACGSLTQLHRIHPSVGVHDWLRSVSTRVHASLEAITESAEFTRQQIEQQRELHRTAADARAESLHAMLDFECASRTAMLERQLVRVDAASETLQREQAAVREALTSHTDDTLLSVGDGLSQRLDEAVASVASLPSVPVSFRISAQFDAALVLHAIANSGVVYGDQPATMLEDRAFALLIGRGAKSDVTAAFAAFKEAAAQGNTTAAGYLAEQTYYGLGVKEDTAHAKQLFVDAARNGDTYSRAMVIVLDKRVAEYGDAFSLFRYAAANGHVAAEHQMGICFHNGVGCIRNRATAADCFRRAADQGYAIAQSALGRWYETRLLGGRCERDENEKKAVALYRLAADQGFAQAQNFLGLCYVDGIGVSEDDAEDYAQAAVWFRLAADQGLAAAMYNLGTIDDDPAVSAVWFRRAADEGDSDAQNALGDCYYTGDGVDKDLAQAVSWYMLAAAQGDASAQCSLGSCFVEGVGVVKDFVQATKWLAHVVDKRRPQAEYLMGVIYATGGYGVAKDTDASISWHKRAVALGWNETLERTYVAKVPVPAPAP